MENYGKELIIDLRNCDIQKFNRTDIEEYFIQLCDLIKMERGSLFWWDYAGYPKEYEEAPDHLKGISAIQFIKTSNITLHSLDILKKVFLNIFSCKDFDTNLALEFTKKYFEGEVANYIKVLRI